MYQNHKACLKINKKIPSIYLKSLNFTYIPETFVDVFIFQKNLLPLENNLNKVTHVILPLRCWREKDFLNPHLCSAKELRSDRLSARQRASRRSQASFSLLLSYDRRRVDHFAFSSYVKASRKCEGVAIVSTDDLEFRVI